MSITEKITTTTEYNGNTSSTIGENDEDHDGIQTIIIYILIGVAIIIVLTAILWVVIKIMKRRIIEENEIYGRARDFEEYYEQEKNAKIVDTNDYYKCRCI